MQNIDDMTRQELEDTVVLEDGILPLDTPAGMAELAAMTRDELLAVIGQWLEDGDECA